jgi:hypothetical protein
MKLDANLLLQEWCKLGVTAEEQKQRVENWLKRSRTLVELMADEAGRADDSTRLDAVKKVVELARKMTDDDREYYARRLSKAMRLGLSEWRGLVKVAKNGKGDKDASDEEAIYTTGGWIAHHLVELFFQPDKRRFLLAVKYPDGRVSDLMDQVNIEGRKYKPLSVTDMRADVAMEKHVVLLPSELGEQMSEEELLSLTSAHIHKYFDFGADRFFEEFTPNYIPFTYTYDAFSEVSYLRARGDYGTGKTRFIKTVGKICYRATYISGGTSPAVIYNLLDDWRGVLVVNEGDFTQSDDASIIAKIFNGGTERDEFIGRMAKNGAGEQFIKTYNIFGPKVIATRRDFDDRAIESRCMTMDMVPFPPRPDIPISSPPAKELEDLELRNLWMTYRMYHAQERITVDEKLADRSVEPRLNQITMSLMMTITSPTVRERIRGFLQEHNAKTKESRYNSKTARVVEGLVMANAWGPASEHPSDENRVYLKDVTKAANARIDEMKRQMDEGEDDDEETVTRKDGSKVKKKAKMTSRGVSFILETFCQLPTRRTSDGKDEYRGTMEVVWDEVRIKSLCERFGVQWLERGSVARPKEIKINLNEAPDGFKKARNEWYGKGGEE